MNRYLRGDLPEPEQSALEQELLADREKFERVWELENELIDNYVRGRLSHADRERFERHYLASPRHRKRVLNAGILLKAADRAAEEDAAPIVSSWSKLMELLPWRGPAFSWAMAMALLLLTISLTWLLIERAQLSEQIAKTEKEAQAERSTLQQLEQERARQIQGLEKEIAGQRQHSEQLNAEIERLREGQRRQEQSAQSTFFTFILTPGLVRGSEAQQLAIPRGASQVQLWMKLEGNDYRSYQVKLRAIEGREILQQQSLRVVTGKDESFLSLTVPAGKLATGDYILTLSGRTAAGNLEEIDRYIFRVR
ncbi:MAG: hypothetical protein MOB07_27350 [Acidobacteria bacterium]|nr:hypothetical protein [Acidobacteriota bacterium]